MPDATTTSPVRASREVAETTLRHLLTEIDQRRLEVYRSVVGRLTSFSAATTARKAPITCTAISFEAGLPTLHGTKTLVCFASARLTGSLPCSWAGL
jgi:hypothetical protein